MSSKIRVPDGIIPTVYILQVGASGNIIRIFIDIIKIHWYMMRNIRIFLTGSVINHFGQGIGEIVFHT